MAKTKDTPNSSSFAKNTKTQYKWVFLIKEIAIPQWLTKGKK
jgi:hypothetical protein